MRRFVTLALVLIFSIPVGLSISGCSKGSADFCNGGSSGEQTGQITSIDLEPRLYGVSLNYGSYSQIGSPSSTDCKGDFVGVVRYTYGTTNINFADISPSGSICAGSWNRNSPGGVPDYTTCTAPTPQVISQLTSAPSFTAASAPTATLGASATLTFVNATAAINGTIDIQVGSGSVLTGSIAGTASPVSFAAAFNTAFANTGISALASGSVVTITGPAGTAKTLSFTGTSLSYSGYVPLAYVTASAGGAVSNAVPVYVHPIVSSVVLTPPQNGVCLSQGTTTPLTANVYTGAGTSTNITPFAGPLSFQPQDGTVVSINSTVVPPIATAQLPGSTIISVATSNAASPAGVFYTCPPKSITLSVPNTTSPNTPTSITLNQNTPQAITAVVTDTGNNIITGLNLEYISTSPRTVGANSAGSVTASYPGAGAITAVCQPSQCNPSPLNQLGILGNGLPITSNPITVTTPGTVNTVLYMASTSSQYFTNIDFSTNAVGSPVRLPYVPNSMISDQAGQTLFFGSPTELMEVSTITNSVSKEDASVKGTVVGVSNDGSALVMSDAVHNLIYIYYTSNGSSISFGGTATRAQFSPDNQSIYIAGQYPANTATPTSNFFVYSVFTGWHQYLLPTPPVDVAVTVPAVGAYLAGANLNARSYCSIGTPPALTPIDMFYPPATTPVTLKTDRIGATNDGKHILGATATGNLFTDFSITLPSLGSSGGISSPGACPAAGSVFTTTAYTPQPALGVTATAITGVIPAANSSVAFVTYTGSGKLPAYTPSATGPGTLSSVTLSGTATAPVSGIFSPDGLTFYTGTSGDNLVHLINVPTLTDTKTITPALPVCALQDGNGNCTSLSTGFATPTLLADKPRPTT